MAIAKLEIGMWMKKRKANLGFTLIEILIVMLIITIVGSIAILTINKNTNTQIKNISHQLVTLFKLAEEQALLQPTVIGAEINRHRIQFYEFIYDASTSQHKWELTSNKIFSTFILPDNIYLKLKQDPTTALDLNSPQPQIIFSKNGEVNNFTLLIGKNNQRALYKISSSYDANLREEAL